MKSFPDRLQGNEVIVFDGGVGTYLYEKGIYVNTCFDELNLTNPDIVTEVHRDYVSAGADVIETNTFGANRFKLAPHGLEKKVHEINLKGAQLARNAAKENVLVAGSVGPLGVQIEPLGKLSYDEARDAFKEQIAGLLEGGVDLIVLETFSLVPELQQAIGAVKELNPAIPIMAQVTIGDDGNLLSGAPLESFVKGISDSGVTTVGLNCSVGPKAMLDALETLKTLTSLPISVQPNAGLPQNIGGRNIYMTSPEYMAEYAKRFIQTGAVIVGGCCGTNPSHIRAIRRAVRALQPVKRMDVSTASLTVTAPEAVHVYERTEKSRLSTKLAKKQFVTLVELVSPKGVSPAREVAKARLQWIADASGFEQGRSPSSSNREPRYHHLTTSPRRASPPILPNLVFGTHNRDGVEFATVSEAGSMNNFRVIDRETGFLLPPSVDEWLPETHLARFVVEVIERLDLSATVGSYRGSGSASYHPALLLGILVYGIASVHQNSDPHHLYRATPLQYARSQDPQRQARS